MGCHFLLQGIFPTRGLNPRLLHWQVGSLPSEPAVHLSYIQFSFVHYTPVTLDRKGSIYLQMGWEGGQGPLRGAETSIGERYYSGVPTSKLERAKQEQGIACNLVGTVGPAEGLSLRSYGQSGGHRHVSSILQPRREQSEK